MKEVLYKRIFLVSLVTMCIIQFFLMIKYWGCNQLSDPGNYVLQAQRCFDRGVWFPSYFDVQGEECIYISAQGFVNWLIVQLCLFGSTNFNYVLNFIMNICIVFFTIKIGEKFFNKNVGYIGASLYCLLYSNWFVILNAAAEVPFLFLCISAFIFCLKEKWGYVISGAICFGLANWMRPATMMFIVPLVIYFIIKKTHWINYIVLFATYAIVLYAYGTMAEKTCGHYLTNSVTSGANLIMSANDRAYGGVQTHLFNDPTSTLFIDNYKEIDVFARDSIYKERAVTWIKQHPTRYCLLYIKKIPAMFVEDSWADRAILGGAGSFANKLESGTIEDLVISFSDRIIKSIVYYLCVILAFITLWYKRKELLSTKGVIFLIAAFGIAGPCLFSIGPRYHYPFTFIVCLMAAYGLDCYVDHSKTFQIKYYDE